MVKTRRLAAGEECVFRFLGTFRFLLERHSRVLREHLFPIHRSSGWERSPVVLRMRRRLLS